MNRRNAVRLGVVGVLAALIGVVALLPAGSETPLEIATSVPADVVEGMQSVGSLLAPAPENAALLAKADLNEALIAAEAAYGMRDPDLVAFAMYSDLVSRAFDESSGSAQGPLLGTQNRLVYVMVFEGLELYPFGDARGGTDAKSVIHHELIVLIDATTGEFISSTTYR